MERTLNLPLQGGEAENLLRELRINPTNDHIVEFVIGLMNLKYELIDALILSSKTRFRVKKLTKKQLSKLFANELGYALSTEDKWIELWVRENLIDDWIRYYLIYQRDHVSDTDHVDYSFYPNRKMPTSITFHVTLTVPDSLTGSP